MTARAEFPSESSTQPHNERSERATEQARAAAEELPLTFYALPWKIDEFGDVVDADSNVVLDPFGTTVDHKAPGVAAGLYLRRIVACVNACDAIDTRDLERIANLQFDRPAGPAAVGLALVNKGGQ